MTESLLQHWSPILSVAAILISLVSFGWQVRTQRRQYKLELYEKRFEILQTIINSASRHALVLAGHSLPPDDGTPEAKWRRILRASGALSEEEMEDLLLAVQHIHYLYDNETSDLASRLYSELDTTQKLAYERARLQLRGDGLGDGHLDAAGKNHDAVMKTTNELIARLTKELYLR